MLYLALTRRGKDFRSVVGEGSGEVLDSAWYSRSEIPCTFSRQGVGNSACMFRVLPGRHNCTYYRPLSFRPQLRPSGGSQATIKTKKKGKGEQAKPEAKMKKGVQTTTATAKGLGIFKTVLVQKQFRKNASLSGSNCNEIESHATDVLQSGLLKFLWYSKNEVKSVGY